MALKDLLSIAKKRVSVSAVALEDITKDRIKKDLPRLRKLIAYWRVYPDKLVDYLCSLNPDNTFINESFCERFCGISMYTACFAVLIRNPF